MAIHAKKVDIRTASTPPAKLVAVAPTLGLDVHTHCLQTG